MRMQSLAILLGLSALLALPACEQRQEQAQAPGQQPAVATKEPAPPPTGAQPAPAPEAQPAGEPAAAPPAGEQQVTVQQQTQETAQPPGQPAADQQQAMTPPADQQAPAAQQQPAGQPRESAEFMGQAPKVEDAPETIILQAKNGNVTLPHREHAGRMECQTCHGSATPGKMPDFNKDKAHPLCQGCHKEQGAGPVKCPDCHKKS